MIPSLIDVIETLAAILLANMVARVASILVNMALPKATVAVVEPVEAIMPAAVASKATTAAVVAPVVASIPPKVASIDVKITSEATDVPVTADTISLTPRPYPYGPRYGPSSLIVSEISAAPAWIACLASSPLALAVSLILPSEVRNKSSRSSRACSLKQTEMQSLKKDPQ